MHRQLRQAIVQVDIFAPMDLDLLHRQIVCLEGSASREPIVQVEPRVLLRVNLGFTVRLLIQKSRAHVVLGTIVSRDLTRQRPRVK